MRARLSEDKQFVYLARQISPREQLAINALGIPRRLLPDRGAPPAIRKAGWRPRCWAGWTWTAAASPAPSVILTSACATTPPRCGCPSTCGCRRCCATNSPPPWPSSPAIGGCGIVMDVRTGEIIAMVSLPDYDANQAAQAPPEERFNRAVTGMYEPGSTFKLQTAGMALDSGAANLWNEFDAAHDIHIGRFTITDFEGKHRFLYLPEVLAFSSNLGAAQHRPGRGGGAAARLARQHGHVRPRRRRTGRRPGRPIGPPRRQLEGGGDADRGLRPRHRRQPAARRAWHRGAGQWRRAPEPDHPGRWNRATRRARACASCSSRPATRSAS